MRTQVLHEDRRADLGLVYEVQQFFYSDTVVQEPRGGLAPFLGHHRVPNPVL
ncbi:MAG TPA: hypothetical protein VK988_07020 [Acidimicrobiales bacterium]|nr:hypothetical protein [Acidimicrobiales bacterium]